jgi:hypothetical protein
MSVPGLRYRNLARRCRLSASEAESVVAKTSLLYMAAGFDRKAVEAECVAILRKSALDMTSVPGPSALWSHTDRIMDAGVGQLCRPAESASTRAAMAER